ncbi:MAG: tetratricopeptide repeat protein [Candidatus Omnitrophica bacterium]|nr:tetratricopeptide repeat protein [Candidatus Omnitrophota bacterium]MBU4478958.1 tetratricopeptide repeat protein [Candidatus Omnitrophota bacterium]MCG2703899.1 tetratricopeptide repeat protein [Candidatus Omnitrophota bacterium]
MLDKHEIFFIAKRVVAVIVISVILVITVPRILRFNEVFTLRIKEFIAQFFLSTVSIIEKGPQEKNKYIVEDIKQNEMIFTRNFLTGIHDDDLYVALRCGEFLIGVSPHKIELLRRMGFLYYLKGDFEKAKGYYRKVVDEVSSRDMTFVRIRKIGDTFSLRRSLLELAALYSEEDDTKQMMDYYKKYIKVSFPEAVFLEMSNEGFDAQKVKLDIYSGLCGDGNFSYRKAIERLEQFRNENPTNTLVIYALGKANFGLINLLSFENATLFQGYLSDAESYFKRSLERNPDYEAVEIRKDLEKIEVIKIKFKAFKDNSER